MTTSPPVPGTLDRGFQRQVVDFVLDWVIFPAVLYAQFDSAMHSQANEGTLNLDGTAVCIAVFLFSFAAGIYWQVLRSHPKKSLAFLLLPEIFITILLIMVVFGSIDDAYESLVAFTSVISAVGGLFAAGQTILMLGRKEESADYQLLEEVQDSEEDECMSWTHHESYSFYGADLSTCILLSVNVATIVQKRFCKLPFWTCHDLVLRS
jgi:hypothetical protein